MNNAVFAPISFWIIFHLALVSVLLIDMLWLWHKKHKTTVKGDLFWVMIWIAFAVVCGIYIFINYGKTKALDFVTCYLLEFTLSMDNVFAFYVIFKSLHIAKTYQTKVLLCGVISAIVMRAIMIFVGIDFLNAVHWAHYLFGAILLISGANMLREHSIAALDDGQPRVIKFIKKWIPIKGHSEQGQFFTKGNDHKWHITPLFLALLGIELADLVFAVDSIPAVLAITSDFFIVYTSNIIAIFCLRALYSVLSAGVDGFVYLNKGLAIVLIFIGAKFVVSNVFEMPTMLSLGIIVAILGTSIVASMLRGKQ